MHSCQTCQKEFTSIRGVAVHATIHKDGPRYSVSRKKTPKLEPINCIHCGKEAPANWNRSNKFCSLDCSYEYTWVITRNQIATGVVFPAFRMKKYLLEQHAFCASCSVGTTWNGKPLVLQLDHIDGDSDNNSLTNLRLLCPNCHTQTETFGARGHGSRYKK